MIQKLIFMVILLLIVGGYLITKDKDYNLEENQEDRVLFAKDFSAWVVRLFNNTKDLTEDVKVKEWLPEINSTANK